MNKRKLITTIFLSSVGLIIFIFLLYRVSLKEVVKVFSNISLNYVIIGFVLYAICNLIRAFRFKLFFRKRITFFNLFNYVCIHNFFVNLLPFRSGELSLVYLLKKNKIRISHSLIILMISRFFDFLSIILLFLLSSLLLVNPPEIIHPLFNLSTFIFFVMISLIFLPVVFRGKFIVFAKRVLILIKANKFKLVRRLIEIMDQLNQRIEGFLSITWLLSFSFLSLLLWVFVTFSFYFIFLSLNIDFSITALFVGLTFFTLTTTLPIQGPGGIGTVEALWALTFVSLGLSKTAAISSSFAQHAIIIVYFVSLGLYGIMIDKVMNARGFRKKS